MDEIFRIDIRVCATCDRWGGQRDTYSTDPYGYIVVTRNEYGKCQGGGFNDMQTAAGATCPQHVKWTALAVYE